MRVILFAGKGGVGKTSISSATGLLAARRGLKTLVMSLDPAHSLSDSFDLDKDLMDRNKGKPLRVDDHLWIQELDIQQEIARHWGEIHSYVTELFNTTGFDHVVAEELAIMPGMEELSSLLYINQYVREEQFDTILLDCAPTGESIRFLGVPTALEWYMRKVFRVEKQLLRIAKPIASRIYSIPLPDTRYFDSIESLYEKLKGIDGVLGDPKITTVRLVTNPEKIVIKETQRAYMYFCLYGICTDGVIINRVLPDGLKGEYWGDWKAIQGAYIERIEEVFNPLPLFKVPLFSKEVVGREDLLELGETLYRGKDPLKVYFREKAYRIEKENGVYCLMMKLPFMGRKDLDLYKKGEELIVKTPGYKQYMMLPKKIASCDVSRAKIDGDKLRIYFGGENEQEGRKGEKKRE